MNPLYAVLAVALASWAALFLYLWRLSARVAKIERDAKALIAGLSEERRV